VADHAEPVREPAPDVRTPAGAPGSLGELLALGGPVTPGVVLASQERVGNQATTAWLQRSVLDDMDEWRRDSLILMAANFIPNPVHYRLTMHYGHGRGAPLRLTPVDVGAMNVQLSVLGWPEVSAAIADADRELRARYRDPEREQAGFPPVIPVDAEAVRRRVTATGHAVANGSLANCTAHVEGEAYADHAGGHFQGTVYLTDFWDFDPKLWATIQGSSGRTFMGEAQTIAGWALLPGQPFDVETDPVPFVQHPGVGRAEIG
jgi:hypothetical protein